jgi:hypothetical protein
MRRRNEKTKTVITMNTEYWDSVQQDVRDAIEMVTKATIRIQQAQATDSWDAEEIFQYAENKLREARRILENIVTPF